MGVADGLVVVGLGLVVVGLGLVVVGLGLVVVGLGLVVVGLGLVLVLVGLGETVGQPVGVKSAGNRTNVPTFALANNQVRAVP